MLIIFHSVFYAIVSGGVTTLAATTDRSFSDCWRIFKDSLRINVSPVWFFAGHNSPTLRRADLLVYMRHDRFTMLTGWVKFDLIVGNATAQRQNH